MLLEENGYQVVNLGPCVPDDLLLSAVREERPLAIIISSVNGHGYRDGLRVVQAIRRDPGIGSVPVIMGGKIGIRGSEDLPYARELLAAGCDAVFTDSGEAHALPTLLARIGALAAADGAR
jgi:methylmalonyl-CoA mutase cobalamin-binding subunit